jgi:hypothetical protein
MERGAHHFCHKHDAHRDFKTCQFCSISLQLMKPRSRDGVQGQMQPVDAKLTDAAS